MIRRSAVVVLTVVAVCVGTSAFAQTADVPVVNWSAPPSWTAPVSGAGGHTATALSDTAGPAPFIPVSPCRLVDTRTGAGFTGAFGPPQLVGYQPRTIPVLSAPTCTGLPTSAVAYSLNFTVIAPAGAGAGYWLKAWPTGSSMPANLSVINFAGGSIIGNMAVVAAGSSGSIDIEPQVNTDLVIDMNGYYSHAPASGSGFYIYSNTGSYAIQGVNYYASCGGICGIEGLSYSTGSYAFALGGVLAGTGSDSAGTFGQDGNGVAGPTPGYFSAGVRGEGSNGVVGITSTNGGYGVVGRAEDGSGSLQSYGTLGNGTTGVLGRGNSASAVAYGVFGQTQSAISNSAGVYGQTATNSGDSSNNPPAGVRGESSTGIGVYGKSQLVGVVGDVYNSSGTYQAEGNLGWNVSGSGTTWWGVYAFGNLGASGTKSFVEPHPTEAGTVIRYVALEGPEAGTYFRGKGQFVGGSAVITVPENFRLVTDPEGLTIQVTPIGDFASVAVVSVGLDEIALKSTEDVAFFYTVNGVRHTFKDWQVTVQSGEFTPESADATIPEYLSPEQKRYLIQNGTYNEDGTVNMQTAERLGWVKMWNDRGLAAKAEAEKATAQIASQKQGELVNKQ